MTFFSISSLFGYVPHRNTTEMHTTRRDSLAAATNISYSAEMNADDNIILIFITIARLETARFSLRE